jgi:hypothetical protein
MCRRVICIHIDTRCRKHFARSIALTYRSSYCVFLALPLWICRHSRVYSSFTSNAQPSAIDSCTLLSGRMLAYTKDLIVMKARKIAVIDRITTPKLDVYISLERLYGILK